MGEEEDRILQMLAEGRITAEEAETLLEAISRPPVVETGSGNLTVDDEIQEARPHTPPPDLSRFRRWWRTALFIVAGSAVLSGSGLVLMYQSREPVTLLGFLCIWPIFIISLFITILMLMTRHSTWMYLNVEEKGGSRFTFGMPMPLGWVKWGVRAARPFVPEKQAEHLETASAFASVMKEDPEAMPIVIDVDDDDGDNVHIYIG